MKKNHKMVYIYGYVPGTYTRGVAPSCPIFFFFCLYMLGTLACILLDFFIFTLNFNDHLS